MLRSCCLRFAASRGTASSFSSPFSSGLGVGSRAIALGLGESFNDGIGVQYRYAGDQNILVEYGEMVLDLNSRFRAHFLQDAINKSGIEGIHEACPGVRCLQVKFDPSVISPNAVVRELAAMERDLPSSEDDVTVPSRILKLPLVERCPTTVDAIQKYMKSVRAEAPYLPDNYEFVARCNGITVDELTDAIFSSTFMVLGLGDVYLGAPCAVNLNPTKRMVAPKYSPARTFTPEGAVGFAGAYMCIYPMASPGGYQLIGRTLPIWRKEQDSRYFSEAPWLLRFFDRIQYYRVSEEELEDAIVRFKSDQLDLLEDAEDSSFNLGKYNQYCEALAEETAAWRAQQKVSMQEATVGLDWDQEGDMVLEDDGGKAHEFSDLADGEVAVTTPISGKLLRFEKEVGETVKRGEAVATLSAMKTELKVKAPYDGVVLRHTAPLDTLVDHSQCVCVIGTAAQ